MIASEPAVIRALAAVADSASGPAGADTVGDADAVPAGDGDVPAGVVTAGVGRA